MILQRYLSSSSTNSCALLQNTKRVQALSCQSIVLARIREYPSFPAGKIKAKRRRERGLGAAKSGQREKRKEKKKRKKHAILALPYPCAVGSGSGSGSCQAGTSADVWEVSRLRGCGWASRY
jgi:hypothetical protein